MGICRAYRDVTMYSRHTNRRQTDTGIDRICVCSPGEGATREIHIENVTVDKAQNG